MRQEPEAQQCAFAFLVNRTGMSTLYAQIVASGLFNCNHERVVGNSDIRRQFGSSRLFGSPARHYEPLARTQLRHTCDLTRSSEVPRSTRFLTFGTRHN